MKYLFAFTIFVIAVAVFTLWVLSLGSEHIKKAANTVVNQPTPVVRSVVNPTPTTGEPVPPPAVKSGQYQVTSSNMLNLVNAQRAAYGLQPLIEIQILDDSCYLKGADLLQQWELYKKPFSHYDSKGRWFTGFFHDVGYYGGAAENLAENYPTDDATMQAWMASPDHRENILEPKAIYFGYAQVGFYRVAHFGGY